MKCNTDKRPNILFILTDDQRRDTIRALGNSSILTPNIDYLVQHGTSFTQATIMGGTQQAVCMASRAMIHTGRTIFHLCGEGYEVPNDQITLGEHLRKDGYFSFHVGKWHQDRASFNRSFDNASRIFGFANGWYDNYGGHWNVGVHDFDSSGAYKQDDAYILAHDKRTHLAVEPGVGGVHSTEMFSDAAVEFLRSRAFNDTKKPFFLNLAFVAPHDPRHSPESFEEMYQSNQVTLPGNFLPRHPFDNGELLARDEWLECWPRRREAIRRHLAAYYAMITHLDFKIGHVLDTLKETGQYENTIIVLAGDNGLALGNHGLMGKQNLYQHSVGVPLVFCGPGVPSGLRSDALAQLQDIFPTLCQLIGISTPPSIDGQGLLNAMSDHGYSPRKNAFFAYRHLQRGVRNERWKLIEYVVDGNRNSQLFDLWSDPDETNNLACDPSCAGQLDALRSILERCPSDLHDTGEQGRTFWEGYHAGRQHSCP